MASISSLGIGSGLDLSALVENLLNAERIPVENSLDRQQNRYTTELSGMGIFRGALSSFQSSLSGLDKPDDYSLRSYTNNNSEAVSASITNDAAIGSYSLDITNLAENHSLASTAFTTADDVVGEGTLQIRFGTITGPGFTSFSPNAESTAQTIIIDSTNNTLTGLRDTINAGDYGVNASIINDGSGYRLTFESKQSGVNAAMEITVTDTGDGDNDDDQGLSRLAYNGNSAQLTETRAAEDATLMVNGIAITSASNTLDKMIEGVSLTLTEETNGTSFNFTVSENTSTIKESITKVVAAYNQMFESLNQLGQAGADTDAGILVGDSALRGFSASVRSLMTGSVAGLSGSINALSTIGISTQSDGTLSIDNSVFDAAIAENPTGALALFAPVGQITDSQIELNDYTVDTKAGSYAVNITQMATQSQIVGAVGLASPITIDADNDNISFYVDGISTGSLSLTQGSYTTGSDLATELQLQINSASTIREAGLSVSVSYDTANNGFVITSNQYGSDSIVEINTVDTNTMAELGLSIGVAAAGLDIAGTIGGIPATGEGQTLTGNQGDTLGLSINVTGGSTGARGSIQFTRGLIGNLNALLTNYLESDGILSSREDGLNKTLEKVQDERDSLEIRLESMESRLIAQFTALDILVSQFQTTGDFLAQQLDSLPGAGQLLNN